MAPKKTVNTQEEVVGQNQIFDIPASGKVGQLKDEIETVDTPFWKDKAKNLAFMEEIVTVQIADTGGINEEQYVAVYNCGTPQFIQRGIPQQVKRKYVEVLARAKREGIDTPEYTDPTGARAVRVTKTPSLKYPFMVNDPNPDGPVWLQRILAEA